MSAINNVNITGRLTRDAEIRHTQGENPIAVARMTLAVDRRRNRNGDQGADFVPCVIFGKLAEVAEKYYKKGTKLTVQGHLQTDSYTDKDGKRVFRMEVIVEDASFAESKKDSTGSAPQSPADDFMSIPDGEDEALPFN